MVDTRINHERSPCFSVFVAPVLINLSESINVKMQEFGLKYEYVGYVSNFVGSFPPDFQWFSCMKTKIEWLKTSRFLVSSDLFGKIDKQKKQTHGEDSQTIDMCRNLEVKYFATNYQIGPSQSGLVSSGQKGLAHKCVATYSSFINMGLKFQRFNGWLSMGLGSNPFRYFQASSINSYS